jgi:nicotinamide-nucleotide amidase
MEFYNAELVKRIGSIMLKAGKTLSAAESCTGGLVGMLLTSVPGSSQWFKGGIIAYSNTVKTDILNVSFSVIEENGAVSKETVLAMAAGVRKLIGTDFSVSISGIAGPGGGTTEKPVGTVWIAVRGEKSVSAETKRFAGKRDVVRRKAADYLLEKLYAFLKEEVK